jgi:hypothetical protein
LRFGDNRCYDPCTRTLITRDDGLTWQDSHLADDPNAYPVAVRPDGRVLVKTFGSDAERAVPLEAFVAGPQPSSTP